MKGSRKVNGAVGSAGRKRKLKVAPVTRAVRAALAASAAVFALAGTGPAFAGDCTAPADSTIHCNGDFVDTLNFAVEDLTLVVGDETPSTIVPADGSPGILADWAGAIGVINSASITALDADGIDAVGSGDISVENDGPIDASGYGQTIGIYAYSDGGDVTVANSGAISAYSYAGLADGIFASGIDVDVSNAEGGAIDASGYDWAAGIEAQGTGTTSVSNDGSISAYAYAAGGYAFGIYATGADVTVANGGEVEAQGYYANGVYVQSGGDATVDNSGSVVSGGLYTSLYATGIHAASGGLDSAVSVTNGGDVTVNGYAGATGIEALATGTGSSASVANSGDVYVNSYYKYASGSTGIVASADGDATIDNSGGITAIASGVAYGAMALSFNGDASVTNSGDISASNTAVLYYAAAGIVSSSQNGAAFADNSGSIDVSTKYIGSGIDASGLSGATAANSGDIAVDAWRAYGIRASAGAGDVSVDNSGTIQASYSGTLSPGQAWGILALTTAGDISVVNSGDIATDVYDQSVGIFARATAGDVSVDSSGTIAATSYAGTAAGIFGRSDDGAVSIGNSGAITAYSTYGYAYGVLGSGTSIDVVNDGSIEASGFYAAAGIAVYGEASATVSGDGSIQAVAYGNASGVNASSDAGDVSVAVGGDIRAGSVLYDAIGIYAYSATGDVDVSNNGYLLAIAPYGLADGIFASGGDVTVSNGDAGEIAAIGYDWAAGIEAQGSDAVAVDNAGTIYARTLGVSEAFGIYASGGAGGASVDNSGLIQVRGYDQATGIYAQAAGDVDVGNSGVVYAGYIYTVDDNTFSSSYATSIFAVSGAEGANVAVDNSGSLYASSFSASSGVEARSVGAGGTVDIANSGDVVVAALAGGGVASGLAASADGDATIDTSGSIYAVSGGMAYGAIALSFNGDASVTNSGDIEAVNTAFRYYSAYGIVSASQNGSASADNEGSISVYSPYIGVGMEVGGLAGASATNGGDIDADAWVSYGARVRSGGGDVSLENSGSIAAHYSGAYLGYAFGMFASTVEGTISVDNSGDISADGGRQGAGIFATTSAGDVSIVSSGDVSAASYAGTAVGLFARATTGTASIDNSGSIESVSDYSTAYGVLARGAYLEATNSGDIDASGFRTRAVYLDALGDASLDNSGNIEASSVIEAYGAFVYSYGGVAAVTNSGSISASGATGTTRGVTAIGYYGATVTNSGEITADGGQFANTTGVFAAAYGDVLVENSGTISVSHPESVAAVHMVSLYGTAILDNSGTIQADTMANGASSGGAVVSDGATEIHNTGDINGAIFTGDADDLFENGQGGTWYISNSLDPWFGITTFGGGDDAIVNGAGGTIHLADSGILLGASGAAGNSFENQGTILTSGYGRIDMGTGPVSLVPSLNPLPLVNDGIIDFVDGAPDDTLVILGDLGGDGAINLDMSLLNGTADLLYVDGSIVDGTTQAINLSIDGVPTTLISESAPVVAVSGNVAPGSFMGGEVLNFDASNFLDLGVTVGTAQSGGVNVVSAAVRVEGLNDTGVLAASVAQGAHSLINSAIGTMRQRNGVQYPLADGQSGLSPWVRLYTEKGNVSPDAVGFGSGANFGFEQENRGREFGMGFTLGNVSFGVLAGNADGTQRLDGGSGGDRLKLHGSGLYATWNGAGFYVDLSHRWMNFDARLNDASGESETSGDATATNIEAGFTGWTAGGMDIVPQVQYTRSKIDNIGPVAGSATQMEIAGGVSERGRVGIALSRSFAGGSGLQWTPYGALSAVQEFDGGTGFTVADAFSGTTSTEGTSALAEFGVGVRKGGLSATAGVNWADGGALDNVRGGQLVVRYTW